MRPPHIVVIGGLNMDLVAKLDRMPRAGKQLPAFADRAASLSVTKFGAHCGIPSLGEVIHA